MPNYLEKIVEFADVQEAKAVFGFNDEFLRLARERFTCKISGRGTQLILSGDQDEVYMALGVFEELLGLCRCGTSLTAHDVRYAIKLAREGSTQQLHELFEETIYVSAQGRSIKPKTLGQKRYIDAVRQNDITLGVGPAGTGKTYLAVVLAVAALRNHLVERIILTRPAVEAGERLGYLPGDLKEKVDPYLRPLYDALRDVMGEETYKRLIEKGIIETAPLAYMRGRTLERSFIILDEAQNTTSRQMKMFLTRFGFGSKMIVNGDLTQVDLPRGMRCGLKEAMRALDGVKGIGCVEFSETDVIRHDVVARIIAAYAQYEQEETEK